MCFLQHPARFLNRPTSMSLSPKWLIKRNTEQPCAVADLLSPDIAFRLPVILDNPDRACLALELSLQPSTMSRLRDDILGLRVCADLGPIAHRQEKRSVQLCR